MKAKDLTEQHVTRAMRDIDDVAIRAARDAAALILTREEAVLYDTLLADHGANLTTCDADVRVTVEALEALGRLRTRNIERSLATDPAGLADAVRSELARAVAALAADEHLDRDTTTPVVDLAEALETLTGLAQTDQSAYELNERTDRELRRLQGAAGALLDGFADLNSVAGQPWRSYLEGRLEHLIPRVVELARVTDHPLTRP